MTLGEGVAELRRMHDGYTAERSRARQIIPQGSRNKLKYGYIAW